MPQSPRVRLFWPVRKNIEAGVVNMPVPIILLTIREKTSNHVSPRTFYHPGWVFIKI